jgi:hypothetical protein
MKSKYVPRNDYVVCRLIDLGKSSLGIVIPSISRQGKEMRVVSIGSKVEGLKVNDSVLISASTDTFPLPDEKDLFAVKQEAIAVVISDEKE